MVPLIICQFIGHQEFQQNWVEIEQKKKLYITQCRTKTQCFWKRMDYKMRDIAVQETIALYFEFNCIIFSSIKKKNIKDNLLWWGKDHHMICFLYFMPFAVIMFFSFLLLSYKHVFRVLALFFEPFYIPSLTIWYILNQQFAPWS